mgnify:FL=1
MFMACYKCIDGDNYQLLEKIKNIDILVVFFNILLNNMFHLMDVYGPMII